MTMRHGLERLPTENELMNRDQRGGFTLVELLVVIGIVNLAVALLAPATLQSREAARLKACEANLKEIGLATHAYIKTHRHLPSGYVSSGSSQYISTTVPQKILIPLGKPIGGKTYAVDFGPPPSSYSEWRLNFDWGWHSKLLPHMRGEVPKIDYTQRKNSSANISAMRAVIKPYVCPSARLPGKRPGGFGYTTYRCSMGTRPTNGVMYRSSKTRLGDVADGTTQTLLIGETLIGLWGDGYSCCARVADDNNDNIPDRMVANQPRAFDTWWTNSGVHYFGFGSWHPDVCPFVFVDGHVKSLNKKIDFKVFKALATRAGKEQVKVP